MGVEVPTQADFTQLENYTQALEARIALLEANGSGGGGGGTAIATEIRVEDFGASPSNADNTQQIQAALDAARATAHRRCALGPHHYPVSGPLNTSGVDFYGVDMYYSRLRLTTPDGILIWHAGEINGQHVPGGQVRNMGLDMQPGLIGFAAIHFGTYAPGYGTGMHHPDRCNFERLRITGGDPEPGQQAGRWRRAINGNCTQRLSPLGLRGGTIRDVTFFNTLEYGVALVGVQMFSIDALKGYGTGLTQSLLITGTSTVISSDVQASKLNLDGPVIYSNVHLGYIQGDWTSLSPGANVIRFDVDLMQ